MLSQKMNLVNTVRSNRILNCVDVTKKKLTKNEVFASSVMLQWQDKREVILLSTKHTDNMRKVQQRGRKHKTPL